MAFGPKQTPRAVRGRMLALLASYFEQRFGTNWRDTSVTQYPCLGCKQLLTIVHPKLMDAGTYKGLLPRYFYGKFARCTECPEGITLYCLDKKHARSCSHPTDMELELDFTDFTAALILLTKWGRSELERELKKFQSSHYLDAPETRRGRPPKIANLVPLQRRG